MTATSTITQTWKSHRSRPVSANPLAGLLIDCREEGAPHRLCDRRRNSISDHSTYRVELHRFSWPDKLVILWKSLEYRRFPQGNRTILLRMAEPSVPKLYDIVVIVGDGLSHSMRA